MSMVFMLREAIIFACLLLHAMASDNCPNKRSNQTLPSFYTIEGQSRLNYRNMDSARLAPLTEWAQRYIWETQHPRDCSRVEFVLNPYHRDGGIGSQIHVASRVLQYALHKGLVMAWGDGDCRPYADHETCGATTNCECFFQPLTNCSREEIMKRHVRHPVEFYHWTYTPADHPAPPVLEEKLRASYSFTDEEIRYWWRAQGAAYLMRLNEKTLNAIIDIRTNESNYHAHTFPLPKGTIHAHIRAGDMSNEMRLVPSHTFLDAAVRMATDNPFSYTKTLYVSSDSSERIKDCLKANPSGWSIKHARMFRQIEGQDNESIQRAGYAGGIGQLALRHLSELMVALEADAWIGTRRSNWNRLVDEMRCVIVDKCHGVFREVGDTPPGQFPW